MIVEGSDLRRVAGHFPTGVTVVTTTHDGRPCGLTVNSFASVSLDPPLVLVCVSKAARAYACVEAERTFVVNVLAEGQDRIARVFASTAQDKFASVDHRRSPRGLPILDGVHAWLECDVVARHAGGRTHTIYVGRVSALATGSGRPLVFHGGRYTALAGG
ncbi:MAG TPA: flavin reductase family protein [Candidatus Limnocylindria bacterium]